MLHILKPACPTPRSSDLDVISGVPLLSDVPILGNLFKTTGNNKDRTELLVLITPLVIRDDAEALALTEQLRRRLRALQPLVGRIERSEEHTSELQSLMRISYAVFCLQ